MLKRLVLLLVISTAAALAQNPPSGGPLQVTADPSGSCQIGARQQYNYTTGTLWGCLNGTWTAISGTGSGVSSVSGSGPIVSSGGLTPAISCPTCVVPLTCTSPDVLQTIGGTATCVSPIIVTSGAQPPQNGLGVCPATTQKCEYVDTTDPKGPIFWYRLSGGANWILDNQQSGTTKVSNFTNFPNATGWPDGTTWFIYDCLDANCLAGGGSFLGAWVANAGVWGLQGVIGTQTGGNGAICATSLAKSGTMHFIQTCPYEMFYVPMNGTTQTTVDWTCSAGITCQKKDYVFLQDSTGGRTFTYPSTDHNGMTVAYSGANTAALQECDITGNGVDFDCFDGTVNVLSSAVGGTLSISNTVTGAVNALITGVSIDPTQMLKTWCSLCASGTSSQATRLKQYLTTVGSSGVVRIGGASVNYMTYTPATAAHTSHAGFCDSGNPPDCVFGNADLNNLADFMCGLPSGWKLTMDLNYRGNNSSLIASEATYLNGLLGASGTKCTNRLLAFEIDNEPDNRGGGSTGANTFTAQWVTLATAVAAATPSIPFIAPSLATVNGIAVWDTAFWGNTSVQTLMTGGYLSNHYYKGGTATTTALLQADNTILPSGASQLVTFSAAHGNLPIFLNETASFANGGTAGVSNVYAAALYMLDQTFQFVQNVGTGISSYTGQNWISIGGSFGGTGDVTTAGTYSQGYTPFQDSAAGEFVNAPLYGMLMAGRVGTGNLITTTCSVGGVNETCRTVKNGSVFKTVIINKDLTQNSQLTVTYPSAVTSASYEALTAPAVNSTSGITIQGAALQSNGLYAITNSSSPPAGTTVTVPGGSSTTLTVFIPALTAIVLTAQ